MTIVLCSKGYPEKYEKDREIKNLDKIISDKIIKYFMQEHMKKTKKSFQTVGEYLNITSVSENLWKLGIKSLINLKK